MKIGILTYHRAENYGALLQAFALKTYLESLGHEVSFVDYWPNYHNDYFELFSWRKFRNANLRSKLVMIYYLFFYVIRKRRKNNLQEFMYSRLGLSRCSNYSSDVDRCDLFDVVFYGSDQIWRKQGMKDHPGFDFWYFGSDNVQCHKKIAYAASMGKIEVDNQDLKIIKGYLQQFSRISVRESSLMNLLSSMDIKSQLVIDPVFLLSMNQWRNLSRSCFKKQNGKYILLYNLLNSTESVRYAEFLSVQLNLPIIEISKRYSIKTLRARYNHTASVEEFVSLIDNADYVVSNSFHGVAFSIMLHKQFCAVGMGNRADRVKSLLSLLGLDSRYVNQFGILLPDIDYLQVDTLLIEEVTKSKNFIESSICD